MRVLLLSMRAMVFMVMRGIFCYGCCDVVVFAAVVAVAEATALATTPDRRVPLLRVRAILAPQLAESGRLLGLRETEFGDPLAVGAELIGHFIALCLCKTGTNANWLSLLLSSFSSARIFGSTSNAEKEEAWP